MTTEPRRKPRVQTLRTMEELLRAFTPDRPLWKLHELAGHLGWDKATTYRFLTELVSIGVLERDDEDNYTVGLFCLELASVYLSTNPQRRLLVQRVDEIAAVSGLTTQLGIFDGDGITIVAYSEGDGPLRAAAKLGQRLPLHASALGKAVLTQLDEETIQALLPERLRPFTARTVQDRAELIREIRAARVDQLIRVDSEYAEGLYVIAIPIPPMAFASAPAALCCAGPSPSIAPSKWRLAEQSLRQTHAEITKGLDRWMGWHTSGFKSLGSKLDRAGSGSVASDHPGEDSPTSSPVVKRFPEQEGEAGSACDE